LGQSKTRVQRFIESNKICIFCGGATASETEDHCPPRTIFIDRKWPEGYVFAACKNCNSKSSDAEYLVGLMVKMGWGLMVDSKVDKSMYDKIFSELRFKKPAILTKMQNGLSAAAKKRLAKDIGYIPPNGGLYADMPLISFPEEFNNAIKIFGRKLAIALHYKHTNKIAPQNFGFKLRWATNYELIRNQYLVNEEILNNFAPAQKLVREKVDLSSQFNYSYVITEDNKSSAFHCSFSESFEILFLLSFDNIIEGDSSINA